MGKGTQQQGKPYPPLRIPHQRAHGPCRGNIVNFTVEGQKRRQPDPAHQQCTAMGTLLQYLI